MMESAQALFENIAILKEERKAKLVQVPKLPKLAATKKLRWKEPW